MYSTPMLLVASHDPVHRNFYDVDKKFSLNNFMSAAFVLRLIKKTIANSYFFVLDIKKWRIAHTFVVYKSDDL